MKLILVAIAILAAACGDDDGGGSSDDAGTATSDAGPGADAYVAQGLIFFDDFEYDVSRDDPGASSAFAAHGWNGAKTQQDDNAGARGYVYTASSIPGYSGAFPGLGSSRALVLEAKPQTLNGQTDFYVQYGNEMADIGHIPPNHWFQFWLYSPNTAPEESVYTQGKFIYPTRTTYPATLNNDGYVYILTENKSAGQVLSIDCDGDRAVPCDDSFFGTNWNGANGLTNNFVDGGEGFDANLSGEPPITPENWTLVKIHIDLSGTDSRATPGQAVYEQWIRRMGSANWIKTTEWIGGVTQNNGGPINFTPSFRDGFRMFRMPTTVGASNSSVGDWYDHWLYIDDFALAGREDALPVY